MKFNILGKFNQRVGNRNFSLCLGFVVICCNFSLRFLLIVFAVLYSFAVLLLRSEEIKYNEYIKKWETTQGVSTPRHTRNLYSKAGKLSSCTTKYSSRGSYFTESNMSVFS